MNILFSPAHYFVSDKIGSEASWPYYALKALAEKGHRVWAICGVADLNQPLPENITLITIFGQHRDSSALVEYRRKLLFYRRVAAESRRIIKENPIDVVHHFAPISPQSPNLLAARGALKKIPFTMGPGMAPQTINANLDVALGVKNDWRLKVAGLGIKLVGGVANHWHRKTLAYTDHFFAVTTEAGKYYQQFLPKNKISVVPAGIDVSRYTSSSQIKHNPQVILAVCFLIQRKGIDLLLQAFKPIQQSNPKARLWIVGNGPEEKNLKKLARDLKVDKATRFWGFVDNTAIAKYYAEAGIFVSPTRNEPFGQTLLEAMAAGLPVVASHTGGIPDIVSKDVGRTFPIDDESALTGVLEELLKNPDQMIKMGEAARRRVLERYDWSVIMDQYLTVWKKLLKDKQS